MNESHAYNNLLSLKSVFDKLHLTFWLDEGTALGAHRGNEFIPNEGDIDIGMLGEDANKLPRIIEELKLEGWHFFHLNEHPCGVGKQLSCIRLGISVDISVYYLRGDKRWRLMFDLAPSRPKEEMRYFACVYPKHIYENLEEIDFLDAGTTFLVPPREFLELQYGDWRNPNPCFKWQTDYLSMRPEWEIK